MNRNFATYRRFGHRRVSGWLKPEVLEILEVLDQAQHEHGIAGSVAEIGVHHGRLFIGLTLLQRHGGTAVAIDVFGDQALNVDQSGKGDLAVFQKNVKYWCPSQKVVVHQGDSTLIKPDKVRSLAGGHIRIFSVDGGHTDSTVSNDMKLAEATLGPGGILVADDVFNEQWPGVATGTLKYLSDQPELVPFAIGFNKVFFASPGHAPRYRSVLLESFSERILLCTKMSEFSGHEVLVIFRVPRAPKSLLGRSKTVRNAYNALNALRSGGGEAHTRS